ncbi:MAG: DUF721 domain-containing protein [Planctomycetota bacterium]|nr:MAG: DUF721 domain-containing protein [Planctomycetota bacterium]
MRRARPGTGGQPLGDLLSGLLAGLPSEGLEQLAACWREVAGEAVARHTRVLGYRAGQLRVAVEGAALLGELEVFERSRLERALADRLPGFRKLRLVAGGA